MTTLNAFIAPLFQNCIRDLLGEPAVNGEIYSYKATDHGTKKPIYKDKEHITPWPNPIQLDGAGCVPTPFEMFFTDDEKYYIEVKDNCGATILTVDNYPQIPEDIRPQTDEIDIKNFILNDQFRYLYETKFETGDLTADHIEIAPTGWSFYRDNTNGTISIEFIPFAIGQTDVPNNPANYLRFSRSTIIRF